MIVFLCLTLSQRQFSCMFPGPVFAGQSQLERYTTWPYSQKATENFFGKRDSKFICSQLAAKQISWNAFATPLELGKTKVAKQTCRSDVATGVHSAALQIVFAVAESHVHPRERRSRRENVQRILIPCGPGCTCAMLHMTRWCCEVRRVASGAPLNKAPHRTDQSRCQPCEKSCNRWSHGSESNDVSNACACSRC